MAYLWRENHGIYFDDNSEGEAIITIHGFAESGMYWSRTGVSSGLVDAGYRVIDMDMRGHGRSVPIGDDPGYDVDSVASDFAALADHLGIERFHLLTHATGGMAALRYAMNDSSRLISLMSTDTGAATAPNDEFCAPEFDGTVQPCKDPTPKPATPPARRTTDENMREARKGDGGPFLNRLNANPDPDRCWQWTTEILATGNLAYRGDFARTFYLDPNHYADRCRGITCPSLVLLGEHDVMFVKAGELLARTIPNVKHVVMPGLGHMTAIEDPDGTLREVRDFLGGLS
mgnify:CR=1 FL=1